MLTWLSKKLVAVYMMLKRQIIFFSSYFFTITVQILACSAHITPSGTGQMGWGKKIYSAICRKTMEIYRLLHCLISDQVLSVRRLFVNSMPHGLFFDRRLSSVGTTARVICLGSRKVGMALTLSHRYTFANTNIYGRWWRKWNRLSAHAFDTTASIVGNTNRFA